MMTGSRDTVKEFMSSGIWLLGTDLGLGEAEVPVSKVLVPLPKFDISKPGDERDECFVAKIAARIDRLIGRYGWKEHKACLAQIPTVHLNRVFEDACANSRPQERQGRRELTQESGGECFWCRVKQCDIFFFDCRI
jgi:hypothetical protein